MKNINTVGFRCLGFVPVLTSLAGSCLTAANWQEAGVHRASFHLAALLMKPGYDLLKTLPNLAAYVAWDESLVLNASLPKIGSDGIYTLRSSYDGGRLRYSAADVLALIISLQPNQVIVPEAFCQLLPESIIPYVPIADMTPSSAISLSHGIYIAYDEKSSSSTELLAQVKHFNDRPCYVAGDLSLPLMEALINAGAECVESDRPAADACCGKVYCMDGELSIQDNMLTQQFELIDKHCHCPTCSQQFTRAYLHHLFEHTPLLCQRLLVQHNVYFCNTRLTKARVSN